MKALATNRIFSIYNCKWQLYENMLRNCLLWNRLCIMKLDMCLPESSKDVKEITEPTGSLLPLLFMQTPRKDGSKRERERERETKQERERARRGTLSLLFLCLSMQKKWQLVWIIDDFLWQFVQQYQFNCYMLTTKEMLWNIS